MDEHETRFLRELRKLEIEQSQYENVTVRDQIATEVRHLLSETFRSPPPPGLDPMEIVRERRRRNISTSTLDIQALTTPEGFNQALRSVEADLTNGVLVIEQPKTPLVPDFYIDPESGDAFRRASNGSWINESQQFLHPAGKSPNEPIQEPNIIGSNLTNNYTPNIYSINRDKSNDDEKELITNLTTNIVASESNTMSQHLPTTRVSIPIVPTMPDQTPAPPAPTITPVPLPGLPNGRVPAIPIIAQPPWYTPRTTPDLPPLHVPHVPVVPKFTGTGGLRRPVIPPIPTPTKPVQVQVEMPAKNPYLGLPLPIINTIATERDIQITGSLAERARQLFEFDQIMPDWLQSILTLTVETFQVLTGVKIYVFGALHGVDYTDVVGIPNRDLMNYTRISILMNDPNHPGRRILPGLLYGLSRNLLERFAQKSGIPSGHLRFHTVSDLQNVIVTGKSTLDTEKITKYSQRYDLLTQHKYSNMIQNLYSIHGNEDRWIQVCKTEPHPMEQYILNYDQYTPADLSKAFGMVIPLSQAHNVDRYIRTNLVSYSDVLTRTGMEVIPLEVMVFMNTNERHDFVKKLTDNEIFNLIGIYVPYTSRDELVNGIARSVFHQRFMLPVVRSTARSFNAETLMGNEITDMTVFMVCYGTALKYHTYELIELYHAFNRDPDTGVMTFRRPDNMNQTFSTSDVEGLIELLRCFTPTEEITRLVNLIEEGMIDAREKIASDDEKEAQVKTFDPSNKQLVREYLRQIFYTGMYMRRWSGPGEPFPLTAQTTKKKEEPDAKVAQELGIGIELLKQMDPNVREFCLNLKICEYNKNGEIDHGTATFGYVWDQVIKGKECIRMGSTKFIGTGFHYLRILFRETIPGMNVRDLDRIV
jgi:hypothetical protein